MTKQISVVVQDPNAVIEADIAQAIALEKELSVKLAALQNAQSKIDSAWESVKGAMITHNIKSIKGGFGSITVAERTTFKTDDTLPHEYYKEVPDPKTIGNVYKLTGEPPQGATPVVTTYLTKRLK